MVRWLTQYLVRLTLRDLRLSMLALLIGTGALFVCNYHLPVPGVGEYRKELADNYSILSAALSSGNFEDAPQELVDQAQRRLEAMRGALAATDPRDFSEAAAHEHKLLLQGIDSGNISGTADERLIVERDLALLQGLASMAVTPQISTDVDMGALMVAPYALGMLPGAVALLPAALASALVLDASSRKRILGQAPAPMWSKFLARISAAWICALLCLGAAVAPATILALVRGLASGNGIGALGYLDYPVVAIANHELRITTLGPCLTWTFLLIGATNLLACTLACGIGTACDVSETISPTSAGLIAGVAASLICDLPSRLGPSTASELMALLPTNYLRAADVIGYPCEWASTFRVADTRTSNVVGASVADCAEGAGREPSVRVATYGTSVHRVMHATTPDTNVDKSAIPSGVTAANASAFEKSEPPYIPSDACSTPPKSTPDPTADAANPRGAVMASAPFDTRP